MALKATATVTKALLALRNHTDWADIAAFLQAELGKTYEVLVSNHDVVRLHQMQGKAQFIQEFLNLAADAPQIFEKLRGKTL